MSGVRKIRRQAGTVGLDPGRRRCRLASHPMNGLSEGCAIDVGLTSMCGSRSRETRFDLIGDDVVSEIPIVDPLLRSGCLDLLRAVTEGGSEERLDAVIHIFGALAEFERDIIQERTQAGLHAARARGEGAAGQNHSPRKKRRWQRRYLRIKTTRLMRFAKRSMSQERPFIATSKLNSWVYGKVSV